MDQNLASDYNRTTHLLLLLSQKDANWTQIKRHLTGYEMTTTDSVNRDKKKIKNWKQEAISPNKSCNSYSSSCRPSCASLSTRVLTHMQSLSNNTRWTVSKHCSKWQVISFIVALRCMKSRPFYKWLLQDAHFVCSLKLNELSRHNVPGLNAFLHRLHRLPVSSHSQSKRTTNMCWSRIAMETKT